MLMENDAVFATVIFLLGWAVIVTWEWVETKQFNKRIVQTNNEEHEWHNMTKLELAAEKQCHAETKAKLAHAEKMLYGTERLRKDVMNHAG